MTFWECRCAVERRSDLPAGQGNIIGSRGLPEASHEHLSNQQLRNNIAATSSIRPSAPRSSPSSTTVALRDAGDHEERTGDGEPARIPRTVRSRVHRTPRASSTGPVTPMRPMPSLTARRGQCPGARDNGRREVIKVKSMATQEIGLNEHLETEGIDAFETDLAELIVQLGEDKPSHILVPAIHRNRDEIREIFMDKMPDAGELTNEPAVLAEAARRHLRHKFLTTKVAISGANFGIAETGTLGVVESEGNGRMCLTLPETLITVMGIEKLLPKFADLEVFMQLLPRSSTGERMNPYTSFWTGVSEGDGPQNVHLILLDNGRTRALAD